MTTELYARLVMVSQSERYTELYARPLQTTCRPHLMFSGSAAGSKAHSEHRFPALPPNSARFGYATEGALFISAQLSTDAVSALRKVRVLVKLQALVYDILPSFGPRRRKAMLGVWVLV